MKSNAEIILIQITIGIQNLILRGPGSTMIPVGFAFTFDIESMNNCMLMDYSLHEEDGVIIINPDDRRKFSNVLKFRTAPISECIVFDGRGYEFIFIFFELIIMK